MESNTEFVFVMFILNASVAFVSQELLIHIMRYAQNVEAALNGFSLTLPSF
jgi:hypothetical protein